MPEATIPDGKKRAVKDGILEKAVHDALVAFTKYGEGKPSSVSSIRYQGWLFSGKLLNPYALEAYSYQKAYQFVKDEIPEVEALLDLVWEHRLSRLNVGAGDESQLERAWRDGQRLNLVFGPALHGLFNHGMKERIKTLFQLPANPPWINDWSEAAKQITAILNGRKAVVRCLTLVRYLDFEGDRIELDGVTIRKGDQHELSAIWNTSGHNVPLKDHRRTHPPETIIESAHEVNPCPPDPNNGTDILSAMYHEATDEAADIVGLVKAACMVVGGQPMPVPLHDLMTFADVPWDWFAEHHFTVTGQRRPIAAADLRGPTLEAFRGTYARLHSAYREMDGFDIAVRMFARSTVSEQPRDRLLNAAIGLEIVLANGESGKTEINYRFKTHGGAFLAPNKAEAEATMKRLGKLYDLRCKLAHSGSCDVTGAQLEAHASESLAFLARGLCKVADLHHGAKANAGGTAPKKIGEIVTNWVFSRLVDGAFQGPSGPAQDPERTQ